MIKPLISAGTILACPICHRPQVKLEYDVYKGTKFQSNMMSIPEGSKFKLAYKALCASWCCGVLWINNGAAFVENIGWVPYNPNNAETAKTEQERLLERKKIFTLK